MTEKLEAGLTLIREAFRGEYDRGVADERARTIALIGGARVEPVVAETPIIRTVEAPKIEAPKVAVVRAAPPAPPSRRDEELADAKDLAAPSWREWQVLRVLPLLVKQSDGRPKFATIASTADVPLGSLGAILDGLQRKGYIVREDGFVEIAFHGVVKQYLRPVEPITHAEQKLVEKERTYAAASDTESCIRPPDRSRLMAGK